MSPIPSRPHQSGVEGNLGLSVECLAQGPARKTEASGAPIPDMEVGTLQRECLHQGLDLSGDVGPLGMQGDELSRRVGQQRCAGVGSGDDNGLLI